MNVDEVKNCIFKFTHMDGETVTHECEYKVSSDHRNGKDNKSFWIVSPDKELECFEKNYEEYWSSITSEEKGKDKAFGALVENDLAIVLGINRFSEEVRIARFKVYTSASAQKRQWHGYPSCYWRNDQDIPDDIFLRKFVEMKVISDSNLKKIIRGQRCKHL